MIAAVWLRGRLRVRMNGVLRFIADDMPCQTSLMLQRYVRTS